MPAPINMIRGWNNLFHFVDDFKYNMNFLQL